MTARRVVPFVVVTCAMALLLGAGPAGTAYAARGGGNAAAAFLERVAAYAELHRRLEAALPPMTLTRDPWTLDAIRYRLADGIRRSRIEAREGDLFTPEIGRMFRARVDEMLSPHDISLLGDESWTVGDAAVNEPLPDGASHLMPAALIYRFPPLPEDVEYRIVNADLVLWDIQADLVIDVLRDVFVVPSFV
jgi:hypothetical protein